MSEEKARRRPPWAELNARDKRERARLRRQTQKQVREMLSIEDGLARLRAISDEEWQAAVEEDQGGA